MIIGLFLYGLKMIGDKTELAQTKKALELANEELTKCNQDNATKTVKINKLQRLLERQRNTITQNNNIITQLNDSIYMLENGFESYHFYGKGNGKLVVYTTCVDGGNTSVWIDGEYIGLLDKYQKDIVDCNTSGTISKIVLSGKHHVTGKDQSNKTWDGYVMVSEDQCQTYGLTCE